MYGRRPPEGRRTAVGDSLQLEPGLLITPMVEEMQAIIDADSGASWDEMAGEVVGSSFAASPRLVRFAFLDPRFGPAAGCIFIRGEQDRRVLRRIRGVQRRGHRPVRSPGSGDAGSDHDVGAAPLAVWNPGSLKIAGDRQRGRGLSATLRSSMNRVFREPQVVRSAGTGP